MDGELIFYAGQVIKRNHYFIQLAISNSDKAFSYLDTDLKYDNDLILKAIQYKPTCVPHNISHFITLSLPLKKQIALHYTPFFRHIRFNVTEDKEFLLQFFGSNKTSHTFFPTIAEHLQIDIEILKTIVKNTDFDYNCLPIGLEEEDIIELLNIRGEYFSKLKHKSVELLETALQTIRDTNYHIAQDCLEEWLQDESLVRKIVKQNGMNLEYCELFINNDEVVLLAIQQNALALQFASPSLQTNPHVFSTALQQTSHAFQCIPTSLLLHNPALVLLAIRMHPRLLSQVPSALLTREIILEGLRRDIRCISNVALRVYHSFNNLDAIKKLMEDMLEVNPMAIQAIPISLLPNSLIKELEK